MTETIVAQSSAPGIGSRGLLRLSGSDSLRAAGSVFFMPTESFDELESLDAYLTRCHYGQGAPFILRGYLCAWGNPVEEESVRCALIYWPSGRSFTGEESAELHLVGSAPLLERTVQTICQSGYARLAGPGEYTLRAFLSGRLDLTQAEAILATIDAETDGSLKSALAQLSGRLSNEINALHERLFSTLCDLEAGFDFAEEDITFVTPEALSSELSSCALALEELLSRAQSQLGSERLPRVALVGAPNVGKSSLFNRLQETFGGTTRNSALVSERPGATRDYLETELNVDGSRFVLVDAAGLEEVDGLSESSDVVQHTPRALAQKKVQNVLSSANALALCYDSAQTRESALKLIPEEFRSGVIEVQTKCDLPSHGAGDGLPTSSTTGLGLTQLGRTLAATVHGHETGNDLVGTTALRCQDSLRLALESLTRAQALLEDVSTADDYLVASELRLALEQLGLITGKIHTEDVLDRIFSRFCIGK
ncbi:MAG: tRNA modification GTPase [Planctomycetia bacterium]|nr:tRNA modification GTPase [Planctomycetia bacterium]